MDSTPIACPVGERIGEPDIPLVISCFWWTDNIESRCVTVHLIHSPAGDSTSASALNEPPGRILSVSATNKGIASVNFS